MLVVLLIVLGGVAIWQFGPSIGIDIAKIFSGDSSSSVAKEPSIIDSSIKADADYRGATITWKTTEASSSQVEYWTTTDNVTLVPDVPDTDPTTDQSMGVIDHVVDVDGLSASTTYHYRVKSRNKAGEAVSSPKTFTTASDVLPE